MMQYNTMKSTNNKNPKSEGHSTNFKQQEICQFVQKPKSKEHPSQTQRQSKRQENIVKKSSRTKDEMKKKQQDKKCQVQQAQSPIEEEKIDFLDKQQRQKLDRLDKNFNRYLQIYEDSSERHFQKIIQQNQIIYLDKQQKYAIVKSEHISRLKEQAEIGNANRQKLHNMEIQLIISTGSCKTSERQISSLKKQLLSLRKINFSLQNKLKESQEIHNKQYQNLQSRCNQAYSKYLENFIDRISPIKSLSLRKISKSSQTQLSFIVQQNSGVLIKKLDRAKLQSVRIEQTPQCFKKCYINQQTLTQKVNNLRQSFDQLQIQNQNQKQTHRRTLHQKLAHIQNLNKKIDQLSQQNQKLKQKLKQNIEEQKKAKLSVWADRMNGFVKQIRKQWDQIDSNVEIGLKNDKNQNQQRKRHQAESTHHD